jgi:hypothetical protein
LDSGTAPWWDPRRHDTLILIAIMAALVMLALVVPVFAYLIPLFWQCVHWVALTLYDLLLYGIQRFRRWRARSTGTP